MENGGFFYDMNYCLHALRVELKGKKLRPVIWLCLLCLPVAVIQGYLMWQTADALCPIISELDIANGESVSAFMDNISAITISGGIPFLLEVASLLFSGASIIYAIIYTYERVMRANVLLADSTKLAAYILRRLIPVMLIIFCGTITQQYLVSPATLAAGGIGMLVPHMGVATVITTLVTGIIYLALSAVLLAYIYNMIICYTLHRTPFFFSLTYCNLMLRGQRMKTFVYYFIFYTIVQVIPLVAAAVAVYLTFTASPAAVYVWMAYAFAVAFFLALAFSFFTAMFLRLEKNNSALIRSLSFVRQQGTAGNNGDNNPGQ